MIVTDHGGSRHLSRDDLLLHLLGEGVLEGEVVPPVDQQLVLQVLRGVEVLASRLLPVAPALQSSICEIFSVIFVCKVLHGVNLWKSPFYDGADWYGALSGAHETRIVTSAPKKCSIRPDTEDEPTT